MRVLPIVLAFAAAATGAFAQEVRRETFTSPSGERGVRASAVVPAPPAEVWKAITSADGWKRMGVAFAVVDFRVGGVIETNYAASAPGNPANIRNQIVAYSPERVLVIRNVQAPPGFPNAEAFSRTATVIELEPAGGGTRVTVTGSGFGEGPAFDQLLAGFGEGNAQSVKNLATSYGAR